jgi:hypothetical protein
MPIIMTTKYSKDGNKIREFAVKNYNDEIVELFREIHKEYSTKADCVLEFDSSSARIKLVVSDNSSVNPDKFVKKIDKALEGIS